MKMRISLLLILSLLYLVTPVYAQTTENCLLWRISGKGMAHSSYLFGTIHYQARKLFNFPDSLYTAISNTEVFALEVNPDSMNNGLSDFVSKSLEDKKVAKTAKKEKKLSEILTKDELKTLRENMPENSDLNPEDLTVKQVYLMKDKLTKHKARKDDMPTFMDAFLYTIARDKGKMISGLEHIEDQMKLLDKLEVNDADPKKLLDFFKEGESIEERLMELYMDRDLVRIQKMSEIFSEEQEKMLLSNRNKNMIRSMDSIMALHSLFCAVGTLHLPGKLGLISLLREEGYTVEPVFCNTYTNGADYHFKKEGTNWITMTSEKDGYSIKLPGTPSDVDLYSGTFKMKMCYDLATSRCFLVAHIPLPKGSDGSLDDLMETMSKPMTKNATDVDSKNITYGTLKGKDYFFKTKDDLHYHLQLLCNATDIYMLAAYSKNANIRNIDSFFKSFRLIPKSNSLLIPKKFDDAMVTVSVPEYKPTRSVMYQDDSTQKKVMYIISDPAIGSYYFVISNQTIPGTNYVNDTIWCNSVRTKFREQGTSVKISNGSLGIYNTSDFETAEFSGMKVKGKMIYCGNRVYMIMAQYPLQEKGIANADSFLNSIVITPVAPETVQEETGHGNAFSVKVPEPFIEVNKENEEPAQANRTKEHIYQSSDKTALLTYQVTVKRLSRFYWKSDDSLMVKNWLQKILTPSDSTPVYSYYQENGMICGEAKVVKKHSRQEHHIKVCGDGRTRYTLDCTYPLWFGNNKTINEFYTSFKVLKKEDEGMQSSASSFVKALHSPDSAIHKEAISSFKEVYFSKNDVPVLVREIASSFPDDTGSYHPIADFLYTQLNVYAHELSVKQLEQLYSSEAVAKRGQQFQILSLLIARQDSVEAFRYLKQLLLSAAPAKGFSFSLGFELMKHPAMAKTLYPELLQKADDSTMGYMVCDLFKNLIDSNVLKKDELGEQFALLIEKSKNLRRNNLSYGGAGMLRLLASVNSPDVLEEIRQYQYVNANSLKYTAVKILCDNMKIPDAAVVDSLAADRYYRIDIYNMLSAKNLIRIYPKKYLTQQYLAESYLANADEETAYTYYKPLGSKRALYNGKKQKFYLFELRTEDDSDMPHLGISGPFSDDEKLVSIDEDVNATGVYSNQIDKTNLDTQLKLYLIRRKIDEAPRQRDFESE